jgi:hypothetical protein
MNKTAVEKYLFEVGQQLADLFYNQENIKPLNQSKMKTAVEWLEFEINRRGPKEDNPPQWLKELYEQAKEMEKEQIIDAYKTAMETDIYNEPLKIGKDYFNQTFKSE